MIWTPVGDPNRGHRKKESMKIKFTPDEANAAVPAGAPGSPTEGLGFPKAGIYEVSDAAGECLIGTWPHLFSAAESAEGPVEMTEPDVSKAMEKPADFKALRKPERNK
jgi:hypothetical protein